VSGLNTGSVIDCRMRGIDIYFLSNEQVTACIPYGMLLYVDIDIIRKKDVCRHFVIDSKNIEEKE
jgi:hypothetical protein